MKILPIANCVKTNPIQSQSKPIKANKMPKQTQYKPNTNPNKANFKRPTYTAGNCFQHSMRTRKIRRLGHTPEIKRMTIASSNNWKAEGL